MVPGRFRPAPRYAARGAWVRLSPLDPEQVKKRIDNLQLYINLSVSVDITVSCRVAEGLARRRHGNRPRRHSGWPGANSSPDECRGKMRRARRIFRLFSTWE